MDKQRKERDQDESRHGKETTPRPQSQKGKVVSLPGDDEPAGEAALDDGSTPKVPGPTNPAPPPPPRTGKGK